MAHNVRIRGVGNWTGTLLPSDGAAFDLLQFQGLSKRGGAWAPADPIEIEGLQGLEITGPSMLDEVIRIDLASAIEVEYDSYAIEREHLTSVGFGYGFEIQQLRTQDIFSVGVGDEDVPTLVQTEANDAPTTTPRWWIPLALPVGASIVSLTVTLSASYAHSVLTSLPNSMPRLALARKTPASGSVIFGTPVYDSSADIDAYRLEHDITLTGISSPTFDGTQLWWAVIDGEYGENGEAGLYVSSVKTVMTLTKHDEHQI